MALRRWLRRHERAFAQAALAVGAALWLGAQAQAADARMSTGAADTCELHYRITPRHDTTPRVLDIELEFPAGTREETFLRLAPQWAGVSDYAQALVGWRGASVGVQVAPADLANRWLVSHARGGTVRVAFQARAALPDPGDDQRTQTQ